MIITFITLQSSQHKQQIHNSVEQILSDMYLGGRPKRYVEHMP